MQQFTEDANNDALQRHAARQRPAGRTHCAMLDCRAAILPQRTALGAQLCLECQREADAIEAKQRGRGRR